jgi:uncharacterized RDD family membrane protein YckC
MTPSSGAAGAAGLRLSSLPYAGLQLRVVAFLLDIMVLISCGMLFAAAAGAYLVVDSGFNDGNLSDRAPYVAVAIFLAYIFAFLPLYHVLLWLRWGQTVGMMAVRIKVLSADGGPPTPGQAALRLLGYAASVLPFGLGMLLALFDDQRRALHDRLAGTVVVELP